MEKQPLLLLLLLLGVTIGFLFLFLTLNSLSKQKKKKRKRKGKKKKKKSPLLKKRRRKLPTDDSSFSYDYSYMPYARRDLLTKTEHKFYLELIKECNRRHILVCPKVRLEDLVTVTDTEHRNKYRNHVKSRHVDFVLADQNMQLIAAIELDDPSHNTTHAMLVDEFKDRLFKKIKLPLYRIETSNDYKAVLKELFKEL